MKESLRLNLESTFEEHQLRIWKSKYFYIKRRKNYSIVKANFNLFVHLSAFFAFFHILKSKKLEAAMGELIHKGGYTFIIWKG